MQSVHLDGPRSDTTTIMLHWVTVLLSLDAVANGRNATRIGLPSGKVVVLALETDEEQVMAEEACAVLGRSGHEDRG